MHTIRFGLGLVLVLVLMPLTDATASADAAPAAAAALTADPAPNAYPVVLSGDFTGDRVPDLFFYSPSSAPDVLYDLNPDTDPDAVDIWTYSVTGSYRPFVGDFTGRGAQDIFWYQPGTKADVIWDFDNCNGCDTKPTYRRRAISVNGTYTPVAHKSEVLWYGRGSVADSIWAFLPVCATCNLVHTNVPLKISGSTYQPVAGNFLEDSSTGMEVFWYNPSGPESMWAFTNTGHETITSPLLNVSGTSYKLAVSDLFADGSDDIVFVGPGSIRDSVWNFDNNAVAKLDPPEPMSLNYSAVTGVSGGDFENPGGWFVYDPGATSGSYYDIELGDGGPDVPWVRYDFVPAPLTEAPLTASSTGATAAAPEGRRWLRSIPLTWSEL